MKSAAGKSGLGSAKYAPNTVSIFFLLTGNINRSFSQGLVGFLTPSTGQVKHFLQ